MKTLIKSLFAFLTLTMVGCADNNTSLDEALLDVTPHNIAGTWKLESWSGETLAPTSYVYVEFIRADRTFAIYQNIDSMGDCRLLTGRYNIEIDAAKGAIIRGQYDYGDVWAHRYIVTDLTADRMVWTATDDSADISVYVRAEIPSNVKAEAKR